MHNCTNVGEKNIIDVSSECSSGYVREAEWPRGPEFWIITISRQDAVGLH